MVSAGEIPIRHGWKRGIPSWEHVGEDEDFFLLCFVVKLKLLHFEKSSLEISARHDAVEQNSNLLTPPCLLLNIPFHPRYDPGLLVGVTVGAALHLISEYLQG